MPSFTRRTPTAQAKPAPSGTIPSLSASTPPLHLLPTGIPSLDDLLGGGLPLGGILGFLAPDHHTAWSRLAERYFIAQALVTGQRSVIVGERGERKDVVGGCMWIDERTTADGSESEGEGVGGSVGEGKGGMRIAWRYERMKKFQTTIKGVYSLVQSRMKSCEDARPMGDGDGLTKGSGPELNLMTPIPPDFLAHLEQTGVQTYIPLESSGSSLKSVGWSILSNALRNIAEVLAKHDDNMALRLTIHDLGSVDWGSPTATVSSSLDLYFAFAADRQEIHRFLHALRGLIRSRPVGVLVTFPSNICRAGPVGAASVDEWTSRLGWNVDALIELRGFGDDPTLPPLFHPLHGLISLPVLPTTHHLLPPSFKHSSLLGLAGTAGSGGAGENNLGFRLKRKRFVVETVHLGIEGGTGERRTEPKPELGSLVGASTGPAGQSEGIERAAQPEKVQADEGHGETSVAQTDPGKGVTAPRGADQDKPKKPRARVRFGGEEELGAVEVQVGGDASPRGQGTHDHGHEHQHDHNPSHNHGHPPARPVVRHDRPDLYEF